MHTQPSRTHPENGTEMALRNPSHKDTNLLRRLTQLPGEHALCQETQQERPEEDAMHQTI